MAAYMRELEPPGCLHKSYINSPQGLPRAVALASELSRVRDGGKETFSHQPSCLATRPLGAALSCIYKESQRVQVDLIHYLSFPLLFWEEGGRAGGGECTLL